MHISQPSGSRSLNSEGDIMLESMVFPLLVVLSLAVLGLLVGRIGRPRKSSSVAELLHEATGSLRTVGEDVTEPSNAAAEGCEGCKKESVEEGGEKGSMREPEDQGTSEANAKTAK